MLRWYFLVGFVVLAIYLADDPRVIKIVDWIESKVPTSASGWRALWIIVGVLVVMVCWWLWLADAMRALKKAWDR